MKLHIGADRRGIVHTVKATDAGAADITQLPDLLHGRSASCSAIKRTGRKTIESSSRLGGCATGSIGVRLPSGP